MFRKSRPFHSIRFKVLLIFVLVTTITLSSCFFFFQQYTYQMATERYEGQLTPLRNALSNNIQTYIGTCVRAARGIYYNNSTVLLFTDPSSDFSNAETADSKALFSFLLSIYASLPSSLQIHLSAYKMERSFLITTHDMTRYVEMRPGISFSSEYPDRVPSDINRSIWVEQSHPIHTYGHFLSPYARTDEYVFTVHVPIYLLPDYTNVIAMISVDIETSYIAKNCSYINDMGADVYIADQKGDLIYADDERLIGQPLSNVPGFEQQMGEGETWRQKDALITRNTIDTSYCQWRIYTITPMSRITHDFTAIQTSLMLIFLACQMVLAIILLLVMMRYTKPLNQIAVFMHVNFYKKNYNLKARLADHIHYRPKDEISLLVENIDSMLDTVNRFVVRQYKLLLARRMADLRTLQAQINPHFIYNTLQSIASKTLEKGDHESYDYIASFGQLLQYAMDVDESLVTLSKEIEHAQRYLDLQSIRYECEIVCETDIAPDLLNMLIPKMSLQPLVENSLLHGRLYEKNDGRILLRAAVLGEEILVEVADNGVPMSLRQQELQREKMEKLKSDYQHLKNASAETIGMESLLSKDGEKELLEQTVEAHHGAHIGLSNVFARFLLRFGSKCRFVMEANSFGGTSVKAYLPRERVKIVCADSAEGGNEI